MAQATLDYEKIRQLRDDGWKLQQIADELGSTRGAISKVLKKMGKEVAKAAVEAAPRYHRKKDAATEHLLFLADKSRTELEWIEKTVPPKNDAEYREWQNQKLKFAAEMRKLIGAMADIGYKLFQAEEVSEILSIIDEEIGNENVECQKRIRKRILQRRAVRFPAKLN